MLLPQFYTATRHGLESVSINYVVSLCDRTARRIPLNILSRDWRYSFLARSHFEPRKLDKGCYYARVLNARFSLQAPTKVGVAQKGNSLSLSFSSLFSVTQTWALFQRSRLWLLFGESQKMETFSRNKDSLHSLSLSLLSRLSRKTSRCYFLSSTISTVGKFCRNVASRYLCFISFSLSVTPTFICVVLIGATSPQCELCTVGIRTEKRKKKKKTHICHYALLSTRYETRVLQWKEPGARACWEKRVHFSEVMIILNRKYASDSPKIYPL